MTLGIAGHLGLGDYKPPTRPGPSLHPITLCNDYSAVQQARPTARPIARSTARPRAQLTTRLEARPRALQEHNQQPDQEHNQQPDQEYKYN